MSSNKYYFFYDIEMLILSSESIIIFANAISRKEYDFANGAIQQLDRGYV